MLLLSIKPKYVEKILNGEKQAELRRRKPRSKPGDWLAIYETTPSKLLVAVAKVVEVRVSNPRCLWRSCGSVSGVTRREFNEYFTGTDQAVGIMIQPPLAIPRPVPLDELRAAWPGFNPPQGFIYLSDVQQEFVFDCLPGCGDLKKAVA